MTDIGDYRVMGKLGEGTFSEVIRVRNRRTGKYFAMKRFKKHFKGVEEIENLREIQALRRLNHHPNIIQLEEVIFDAKYGVLSLAFELMDANLYEVLSKKGSPPVHETRAKWMMWQVMKAMDFVHSKGIFHRDIKPENILVRGDIHAISLPFPNPDPASPFHHSSSFPLIKLADLGSCRGVHSAPPFTEYIATRWYRSPECLMFDGVYGYKMDLWGLGCVFFELITKIPLFPGDDEIDQLHKIHNVLGTPSERLLKIMVLAGQQAIANGKADKGTPNATVINDQDSLVSGSGTTTNSNNNGNGAAPSSTSTTVTKPGTRGIFKRPYQFPPTKGCGLRAAFPPHILYGAHRVPPKTAASQPGYHPSDYPGITDECVNLIELLLQYDPDGRPSARQTLKHPWMKECRDVEALEKQRLKDLQQTFEQTPVEILKSAPVAPVIANKRPSVALSVASSSDAASNSTASWAKAGRKANMLAMAAKLSSVSNTDSSQSSSSEHSPALPPRGAAGNGKALAPIGSQRAPNVKAPHVADLNVAPTAAYKSPNAAAKRLDHIPHLKLPSSLAPAANAAATGTTNSTTTTTASARLAALGDPGLTIRRTGSIKAAGKTVPPPAAQSTTHQTLPRLMRAATLQPEAAVAPAADAVPRRSTDLAAVPPLNQSVSVLAFSQTSADLIAPVLRAAIDSEIGGKPAGDFFESVSPSVPAADMGAKSIDNLTASGNYRGESKPPSLTSTGKSNTSTGDLAGALKPSETPIAT